MLVFTLTFPTLVTWAYFVLLAQAPAWAQQGAYGAGKAIQFAFPAVWVALVCRRSLSWHRPDSRGLALGFSFGLLVAAGMVGLYWVLAEQLAPAGEPIRQKIAGMGLDSLWKYAALGVFYALAHSLMEEYYWRWFAFRQLRTRMNLAAAILLSSVGFMSHHVILLATYFGWDSPLSYLFALGVAIGGAAWAWIYHQSQSLYGPWLSHLLVDAAIFVIGYDFARSLWQ